MIIPLCLTILVSISAGDDGVNKELINKLAKFNPCELLEYYKYPCETHYKTTDDNYITALHRVPYGRNGSDSKARIPVLISSGLFFSSRDWLLAGPDKSLGYVFADAGFDVWLGNTRGNIYSRNHTTLNPNTDNKFWEYSMHEMGKYDLSAWIDYILKATNSEKLFYIGYSQGSSMYYILASEKPNYMNKILASFSMSSFAYSSHVDSVTARLGALFEKIIGLFTNVANINEINRKTPIVKSVLDSCYGALAETCLNIVFTATGFDHAQFNMSLWPMILETFPAGISIRQVRHYGQQMTNNGYFRQFDNGLVGNLAQYRTFTPPNYKITNIIAPTYLIYSDNDLLSNPTDVKKLYNEIPGQRKHLCHVRSPKWAHLDYMLGIDAFKVIYLPIINIMKGQFDAENSDCLIN